MATTDHIDAWVDEGLISAEQAQSIREFERHSDRTGGIAREVVGYLGALFILVAGFVIAAEVWDTASRGVRITISGVGAGLLVWAGFSMLRSEQRSTRRVGEVLLMLAAAPIGLTIGLVFDTWFDVEASAVFGFVAALAYSIVGFRWHRSWAQHIALFASSYGLAIALGVLIADDSPTVAAILVAFVGVGWLVASVRDVLPPRLLAEVGSVIALMTASMLLVAGDASEGASWRLLVGALVVAAAALLALGVRIDRVTLIGGGALGLVFYLPMLVQDALPGELGGPLALLVAGGILIGVAVLLTKRARRRVDGGPPGTRPHPL